MKRTLMIAAAAIFGLAIITASAAQHDQHGNMMGKSMMQDCPMKVEGAELAIEDTTDGVALTFTTKSGDVAELRRRAEKMAKMHDSTSNAHMMHQAMTPFAAKYESDPNGARLTLTPKSAEQLEEFRTKVRQHVEQMKKGECPMMAAMEMMRPH